MNFGDMVYALGLMNRDASQISFGMCIRTDEGMVRFVSMGYFAYDYYKPMNVSMPLLDLDVEWDIHESGAMAKFGQLQWEMLGLRSHEIVSLIFTNMPKRIHK